MSERLSRPLIIISAFAVSLLIGLAVTFWLIGGPRAISTASAIGGPFQLVDQNGSAVSDKSLPGKPTIIFFGFTHCPDVCPTALFEMSEVLKAMGPDASRVNAFFVSVDPERDTPQVMKDYLGSFDPSLKGLTGSPEAVAAMEKIYRAYARKVPLKDGDYTMEHTGVVYLMDGKGRFVRPFKVDREPAAAAMDLLKVS